MKNTALFILKICHLFSQKKNFLFQYCYMCVQQFFLCFAEQRIVAGQCM
jgi:hypothetical protein